MDKNVLRNEEDRLLFTFKNAATNATRNCETTTELKSKELRTHWGKRHFLLRRPRRAQYGWSRCNYDFLFTLVPDNVSRGLDKEDYTPTWERLSTTLVHVEALGGQREREPHSEAVPRLWRVSSPQPTAVVVRTPVVKLSTDGQTGRIQPRGPGQVD
jgi:hypothetical protein